MVDFVKLENKDDDKKKNGKKNRSFFSLKTFFLLLLLFFLLSAIISSITMSISPKIAVIPVTGPIMTDKQTTLYGTSISSREIANTLRSFKDDSSVKAILLDINSPGGSPVASDEISRAIDEVKLEKPVYALINEVGASGAFWIAVSADKVYASSMSTVGSIGVTSAGLGFEDFIREHNISYRRLVAGEHKDMGTPFRNLTQEEEAIIQGILNDIHAEFINHVAEKRNMTYAQVEQYATGRIFLGSTAQEIGFIDELGYYPDAINELENLTGASLVVNYGPEPTLLDIVGISALFDWDFGTTSRSQVYLY